ncbi:MAG: hypothetical protein ACRD0H_10145, partial [Actinomycetes bacterium]
VGSVSVALRPAPTLAIGALNISAPLFRLTDAHIDEFAEALDAVARSMPVDGLRPMADRQDGGRTGRRRERTHGR